MEPADVPTTRSAPVTSTPESRRPFSTPVSQATPVTPPPPSTSACLILTTSSARSTASTSRLRELFSSSRENRGQVVRNGLLQLLIRTRRRISIGAPTFELCHMPEAASLQVVVGDLADELRTHGHPGHVLAGVPAVPDPGHARRVRPLRPRVAGDVVHAVRRQLRQQLPSPLGAERGCHTNMLEMALVVMESK